MSALQVAQRYFDAWNCRDADAIVASFADDGTYSDPSAGQGLRGEAIASYAKGLWAAFPDLSFETVSASDNGAGLVAAQWMMHGTNTGSMRGLPPTGRSVTVPGADFIQVEGDRILSVQGYFDSRAVPEQLGLQVTVQPYSIGPFSFGTSTSVQTGKKTKPGAFSITNIEARSESEVERDPRPVATDRRGDAGDGGVHRLGGHDHWPSHDDGDCVGGSRQLPPVDAGRDAQGRDGTILWTGARKRRNDQRLDFGAHRRDVGSLSGLWANGRFREGPGQMCVRRVAAGADGVLVSCWCWVRMGCC